jgi:hypothetical protein
MRVVSFMKQPLYFRRKDLGTHWIGGQVGSTADLDAVVKREKTLPCSFR